MTPPEPDWCLLPSELWQLVTRSVRPPRVLEGPLTETKSRAWRNWVTLVVCLGSTCTFLRAALLGPEAASVWDWAVLQQQRLWSQGSQPGDRHLTRRHRAEMQWWLLRQAGFARSVLVLPYTWPYERAIDDVMAWLPSVEDLTLSGSHSAGAFAALGSQVRKLDLTGTLPEMQCTAPQELQWLRLDVQHLSEQQIRQLAGWLPRLQHFELHLSTPCSSSVCGLQHLSRLPAEEICVTLPIDWAADVVDEDFSLGLRLRQLAQVQLHTLEIQIWDEWEPEIAEAFQILVKCQVSEHVVLRLPKNAPRRLQSLPSGARVVYRDLIDLNW